MRTVFGISLGSHQETEMKAMLKVMGMTAMFVVIGAPTRADDAKTPPSPDALIKALAENGQPGPEHRKLDPLVGDWSLTIKMWTDPSQSPAEMKGTVERKWIMDGRFLQ